MAYIDSVVADKAAATSSSVAATSHNSRGSMLTLLVAEREGKDEVMVLVAAQEEEEEEEVGKVLEEAELRPLSLPAPLSMESRQGMLLMSATTGGNASN